MISPLRHLPSTVNKSLTPKRSRRVVENDEYAAFLRRVIRAYSRRVAVGDIEALTDMTTVAQEIDTAIREAISSLRTRHGYSWADIAQRLGVTRQAAQQHWGAREPTQPTYPDTGPDPDPEGHHGPDCQCPYCSIPPEDHEWLDQL